MMCHGRFINCNKCTTLVGDVDNVGVCACWGAESIWQLSILSPQFCCELKTALNADVENGLGDTVGG